MAKFLHHSGRVQPGAGVIARWPHHLGRFGVGVGPLLCRAHREYKIVVRGGIQTSPNVFPPPQLHRAPLLQPLVHCDGDLRPCGHCRRVVAKDSLAFEAGAFHTHIKTTAEPTLHKNCVCVTHVTLRLSFAKQRHKNLELNKNARQRAGSLLPHQVSKTHQIIKTFARPNGRHLFLQNPTNKTLSPPTHTASLTASRAAQMGNRNRPADGSRHTCHPDPFP